MSGLVHFLLVFDHDAGELIHQDDFLDGDLAVKAYSEMEARYKDRQRIEVVLIGSDSIETVRQTHANYFDGSVTVSHFLSGI